MNYCIWSNHLISFNVLAFLKFSALFSSFRTFNFYLVLIFFFLCLSIQQILLLFILFGSLSFLRFTTSCSALFFCHFSTTASCILSILLFSLSYITQLLITFFAYPTIYFLLIPMLYYFFFLILSFFLFFTSTSLFHHPFPFLCYIFSHPPFPCCTLPYSSSLPNCTFPFSFLLSFFIQLSPHIWQLLSFMFFIFFGTFHPFSSFPVGSTHAALHLFASSSLMYNYISFIVPGITVHSLHFSWYISLLPGTVLQSSHISR